MKKIIDVCRASFFKVCSEKTFRIMRLTNLLLLVTIFNVFSTGSYSQNAKLNLDMKDVPIQTVLTAIEDQSEFFFLYSSRMIDVTRKVDISAVSRDIKEVLNDLFEDSDIRYSVKDRHILLMNKDIKDDGSEQQNRVTGTVTDENGVALAGVTILVKGTTTGTVTDASGKYTLANISPDATLVFSFIGMTPQEIPLNSRAQLDVVMKQEAIGLDEVIVIGYGTARKSDLTGSVVRVTAEDFQTKSMVQVSDMLAGTVAGFYAVQSTSAAGGSSMEIRGPTSLSAGTDPLIVLDGVIFNGSMRDINPNDIQSIDILKDASSAAIFGSKAASGVVLITTTKGSIGKPTINFSTKIGLVEPASHYKPLGPEAYLQFRGDYFRTASNFTKPRYYYTHPNDLPPEISLDTWRAYSPTPASDNVVEYVNRLQLYEDESQMYLAGTPTDYYGMVMVQGLTQDYDISVRGGTDNINYYWSLGYVNNEGIIKGDMFSAIRSRLNVDFKITDWLKVGANTQFSDRDESATPGNLTRTYRISPWSDPTYNPPLTAQADYGFRLSRTTEHPLMEYYYTDRDRKINALFSSIFGEITFPLGIVYKLSFQPRYSFLKDYNFYGDHHTLGYADHTGGYGTRQESSTFEWMIDNLIKWNREIGIHNFDVTLLYNTERLRSWDTNINNQGFSPNQQLAYHGMQFGNTPVMTTNDTEATGDALMARLNYTLMGKYLVTASIRRDGYSAFGQENPRANFPAFALAWKVSDEEFFNIDLINRLKLRISWGVNGNRDIGGYSALANLGSNLWYNGSAVVVGVYNNTLSNSQLRWERTQSLNGGMDIGILNDRIDLSFDYYDMTTTDLLMQRSLPDITGFTSIMSNLGELKNHGFEATLNTININNPKVTWRSNLVFSLNRNKIERLFGNIGTYTLLGQERYGELPDFTNQWFPGKAIDVIWDYELLGIWQEEEADAASVFGSRIGDYKATDVNNDGKYVNLQDKIFIGYRKPRYRIGLRNDVNFLKNFTASLFIRADLGHLGQYTPIFQGSSEFDRFSMGAKPYDYWMPENRNNEYPRLDANLGTSAFGGGVRVFKSLSFVRIQDLSVSYSLPKDLIRRLQLQNVNAFFSIRNLYSFDKWPGWDPEALMNAMPRTFTFGVDISL